MTLFVGLLWELLIISVRIIHSIPLPTSLGVESHTFRWATGKDLNDARCAFPSKPWRFPNDTLHPDPRWSYLHGCTILLGAVSTPEDDRLICQNNNSLFILIGNPGMIWHPLSGQCVLTKMVADFSADTNYDQPMTQVMYKTLMTGCECDINHPNVALFKYDKNKPQRLTFLENNPKTNKQEEWCIRNWWGSSIQVVPKCDFNPLLKYQQPEAIFHEFF